MKDESDQSTIDIFQIELAFYEWCEGLEEEEEVGHERINN